MTQMASVRSVEPGRVVFDFNPDASLRQQHGFVHAGIVSTVLDSACGYAAFSLMPPDAAVLTIEFKINLLAPAQGDCFEAIGQVKKPGRTISVAEAELFSIQGDTRKLIASMTGTLMTVMDRPDVVE